MKNCTILSPKTPKNDLLTFNWGHPSSCNTLSTWQTTNVHFGPPMKLNARWDLPVYPVLKDQSHWKMCEHILKKNIAGQVLTYNSKNFHWLNSKTRLRMDYEWIGKTILKKNQIKNKEKTENQCQNAACEQKNH